MEDVFVGFVCNQAQNGTNIDEYVIYLTTLGGSPFSAISLYNFIKSIPQKTTVYNMGIVASAGVPFFLGFQTRIGVPDCSFLIHQTSAPRDMLPQQVNIFDLDVQRSNLLATDDKSQKIILKETASRGTKTLSASKIKRDTLNSTTYIASEAHKYGFIDRIEIPKLPEKGVLYLTDQYLATLPG